MGAETNLKFEALKMYEDRAAESFKAENFFVAKENYTLAANLLRDIALGGEIALQKQRTERAKELYIMAEKSYQLHLNSLKPQAMGNSQSGGSTADDDKDKDGGAFYTIEKPSLKFSDIAGLESTKEAVKEAVLYPFLYPDLYKRFNQSSGGGMLLYGLPGTGKTMFARATAGEVDATFINVECGALKGKYFGDSEKYIKLLFADIRKHEKAIVFFDEIEDIAQRKETQENNPIEGMVNELLKQMDGFKKNSNTIFYLAATNAPWKCDGAILRRGRIGTHVYVPLPDFEARKFLILKNLKKRNLVGLDADFIAQKLDGYSGSDIDSDTDGFFAVLIKDVIADSIYKNKGAPLEITMDRVKALLSRFKTGIKASDVTRMNLYIAETAAKQ